MASSPTLSPSISSRLSREDSMQPGVGAALGALPSVSEDDISRSMRISLQLEAAHLPNMDTRGKSDPFVVVYRKIDVAPPVAHKDEWAKVGQTETVYNNLNPKWSTTFSMEYRFGANFVLRFNIYDRDSKDDDLSKQDYIGEVRCTVAQIVLADNQRLVLQVQNPKAKPGARTGTLTIRGEEEKGDLGDSVTFQFAATGLRRGKKPFYVLSRKNRNDNDFSPVIYSEVHQGYSGSSQVTTFKPITKSLAKLVNGDLDRELRIQFMDYDRRGAHYRGGSATFTLKNAKAAISGSAGAKYTLKKTKSNRQVVDAGILIMKKCEISVPYSFLDYIKSGTVINLIVAVDMSATNGNPADPNSLHYNNRQAPNEYVIALREVGNVLAAYDTSKTFPAFGFGAALPPSYNETAHCFALTGNIMQPVCNGVEGVIDMYYNALNNVAPYEPCCYGPVLEHVIKMIRDEDGRDDRTVYTVLLLVTDGDFKDFANVANVICSAADLPLSIVIVGVGNSRFVQLERLDGDDTPLCSTDGTPCARDIVQFVQFHKHRYNPKQLAKEVLDEIPDQLVSYMRSKSIKPGDIIPGHNQRPPPAPANISTGQTSGPYIPAPMQPMPSQPIIPTQMQPQQQMPSMQQMPNMQPPIYQYHAQQTGVPQSPYPGMQGQYSYQQQQPMQHAATMQYGQPGLQDQNSQYQLQSGVMHHQSSYPQQAYPPQPQ